MISLFHCLIQCPGLIYLFICLFGRWNNSYHKHMDLNFNNNWKKIIAIADKRSERIKIAENYIKPEHNVMCFKNEWLKLECQNKTKQIS